MPADNTFIVLIVYKCQIGSSFLDPLHGAPAVAVQFPGISRRDKTEHRRALGARFGGGIIDAQFATSGAIGSQITDDEKMLRDLLHIACLPNAQVIAQIVIASEAT